VRAPAGLALLLLLSCADEGEPTLGHTDPCVLPQSPLLGCPPPAVGADEPTIEEACRKLIQCEIYPLDDGPDGDQDYVGCLERLQDNAPDRLLYSLRCIEVSTCIDLREGFDGPCFTFGREP
jgi:hypothetical protein